MTIQELFDELRKEPDWSKEVAIFVGDSLLKIKSAVPNLINETQLILDVEEN